jgi:hypothetical protein
MCETGTGKQVAQLFDSYMMMMMMMIFYRASIFIYHLGMNNTLVGGRSSETSSHPFDVNDLKVDRDLW